MPQRRPERVRNARRDETARRAWLAGEIEDGATAGLALDYIALHAGVAEQIRLEREAFAMPPGGISGGGVGGSREPDRTVAKCLPDWDDDVLLNHASHGEHWPVHLPDQNREAVKLERVLPAERLRLGKLADDYQALLTGELAGIPGWPLHPRLHTWIAEQVHDPATTSLLWGCLQVHRLLASVARSGVEPLVKRRKAMEARWRYLIEAFERDLGKRPKQRGRRNLRGRVVVEYVGPDEVRRFG